MKSTILNSLLFAAILVTSSLTLIGQPSDGGTSAPGSIFLGEKLTYEGKVSRLKLSMSIAELTFSASIKPDTNELVIKSEAVSKGTMLKIFRYSFLQQYESIVDVSSFRIVRTTKHDVQKQRVRDSESTFDYRLKRVSYTETDPKDSNRPPRRIASEIGNAMNDMISTIYFVRLQTLAIGKKFEVSVSDSGLVYKVPVVVTGREQQKTSIGKVWCWRVEPEVFGKGRLIERKGKMILWMTDDARRTPVRAEVDTEYGKVEIKLKSAIEPA